MPDDVLKQIDQNLASISQQINDSCRKAGRSADEVTLVAVTKYAEWNWVQALFQRHRVFGENRPQQLAERQTLIPAAEWHLIGQLQRNKVRLALQHAAMIHSVDSLRLLNRIASVAQEEQLRPKLLLQVNVSGEASKSGFNPDEIRSQWPDACSQADHVDLCGLMTMAAAADSEEDTRSTFRSLRMLKDELQQRPESQQHGLQLTELSMGMSGDYPVAIEEGATLVRIGSSLFEALSKQASG